MNLNHKLKAKICELFREGQTIAVIAHLYDKRMDQIEQTIRERMVVEQLNLHIRKTVDSIGGADNGNDQSATDH